MLTAVTLGSLPHDTETEREGRPWNPLACGSSGYESTKQAAGGDQGQDVRRGICGNYICEGILEIN